MKRLLTFLASVMIASGLFAQAFNRISYQAVVRTSDNVLVVESNIGMQISILQESISGTPVYVERHFPTTNTNGLISLEIGSGTAVSGDFSTIDWGNGPYFVKTDTDLNGGANYTISGTSQLLSVPYALYANEVENITEFDPLYNSSVARGITADDTTNWNAKLDSYTETDPVFAYSIANNITAQDTTRWGVDDDPDNEIQELSLSGTSLSLSKNGGTVVLPDSVIGYTASTVAGFGTTTTLDLATVTFDLTEMKTVLILADVNIWGNGPCEETIRLSIDGNPENRTAVNVDNQTAVGGNNGVSASTSWMTTLAAGSHTIKLRAWNGSCTFYKHTHLHVLILGN